MGLQKQVPYWRLLDTRGDNQNDYGEYRRIASALLFYYHVHPAIKAKMDGNLVLLKVGYRLPPTEEDFFMLYSWPAGSNVELRSSQVFDRKMTAPVYSIFKKQLTAIGYRFTEE